MDTAALVIISSVAHHLITETPVRLSTVSVQRPRVTWAG
jgi:hypothetical protein